VELHLITKLGKPLHTLLKEVGVFGHVVCHQLEGKRSLFSFVGSEASRTSTNKASETRSRCSPKLLLWQHCLEL